MQMWVSQLLGINMTEDENNAALKNRADEIRQHLMTHGNLLDKLGEDSLGLRPNLDFPYIQVSFSADWHTQQK